MFACNPASIDIIIDIHINIEIGETRYVQMLFHFSEELALRLKAAVPARQRSAFVQSLVEAALLDIDGDDPIYRAALAAEADEEHDRDRDLWDALSSDGLDAEA